MHVDVHSVVFYYGNYINREGDPIPDYTLFHRVVYCLFYTDLLLQVAHALLWYYGIRSSCRVSRYDRLYWLVDCVRHKMYEVGLSDLVRKVHTNRFSELLTEIDRLQWPMIEPHRN